MLNLNELFEFGTSKSKKKRLGIQSKHARKLSLERCEDRQMLTPFLVNNTGDFVDANPAVTTLREAIADANTNPGPDTITFDPTVFATPQTITLTAGELNITDSVTIDAEGQGVIVNAGGSSTVMEVNLFSGEEATIDGLTLTNGFSNTFFGVAGLGFSGRGTLLLKNTTLSNNESEFGTGGLYADIGTGACLSSSG